jgi:hypothetical protein
MGFLPMSIATLCYVWTAFDFGMRKDWPMCVVFGAYALANVGLIIVAYRDV